MRALLSCLNSDIPLILNTSYVPQHMLVMACVLRYIMSLEKPILRRQELDAFVCQAFNPDLMNAQYLQELTVRIFMLYTVCTQFEVTPSFPESMNLLTLET